jgi:predicted TIM-barrel fold metal-dependent hydrolase
MRKLILFCLIVLFLPELGFALEKTEQIRTFQERVRGLLVRGILPVIDVEYHHGKIKIERLIDRMDENGVALTWLGPNEDLGSEESIKLNEEYPNRLVPVTVHGDGKLWHKGDRGFLEKLTRDVHSGKYFAMGEFEARHYPSSTNNRNVHTPVDSEGMQAVFKISEESGIPFLLHHEAEDSLLPELERMLTKYPKARMIWCHVGRNRNPGTWKKFRKADTIRGWLEKYQNLYFDLVQSPPGSKYRETGVVEGIMYDSFGNVSSLNFEWKRLFENFQDRFLIGSDVNTGRFEEYDRVMRTFRTVVFDSLKKGAAEKIAYQNAWKMMTGEDWK